VREALALLRAQGVAIDYLRVRAFPFGEEVERFLADHRLVFVAEQNRDAQLRALLTLETAVEKAKLRSLLHYSGLPVSSRFIVDGVLAEVRAAGASHGRRDRPQAGSDAAAEAAAISEREALSPAQATTTV
jgi:2-oxoglutarate ferredoxin oxidoreductase subunit alpha